MKLQFAWVALLLPIVFSAVANGQTRPRQPLPPVPAIEPIPGEVFMHAGPMVGHVTDTTAQLWAKGSNAASLRFQVSESPQLENARTFETPRLDQTASFTGQVEVTDLKPATRYYYLPLLEGRPALLRPYPSFVTAPPAGAPARLRFAFGSCVGPRGFSSAAAFGEMAARRNFDLLLMLGDNHYGDTTRPDKLRDHLFMQRTVFGFEQIIRHTPTYAIWDDHDYGPNNSDGTAAGKGDSLAVFRQWWANPAYGEPDNPGCYYRFSHSGVDFFMIDVRYYRTPNKDPDNDSKTMLGARQLKWLKQGLAESKAPFKVVGSGSEWQMRTQPDGWASFARERQEIFDHITENKIQGVVLLSGDRHFTAGYQVQDRHLEFTSGPLGSGNATLQENPERFTGCDEGKLWMVLELDPALALADGVDGSVIFEPRLAYEIWQAGGGLLERRELSYAEVNGKAKIAASPQLLPSRMETKAGR